MDISTSIFFEMHARMHALAWRGDREQIARRKNLHMNRRPVEIGFKQPRD